MSDGNLNLKEYINTNIDAALENGWVKAFYQPVIRSLTGRLCGAESLARWVDPEHGFMAPDKFIGALEESGQIHKLDCFIVEQVCKDISERISKGLDAVPVSVNFSRLDFMAEDMLKVVETCVGKYELPRDYIHIEITESMIVSDAELMANVIDSFRNAGYEVWMDDFGSGYSSLTLLKDYYFDTLKMDMNFLSTFNDRSKSIMRAAVTMAKDIDIKTLAEGVETQEQIEFLKDIGCGRLQGYYYGKPMPIDDFFAHIREKGIEIEARQWWHYYDVASFSARYSTEPLELLEDDGKEFNTLFMNKPYKDQIFDENQELEVAHKLIYETKSPLVKKYREFADAIEKSKKLETFYYTNNGYILCFQGQELAENEGRHLIQGAIRNISSDTIVSKRNSLDYRLRELNHLFEVVHQINPEKNAIAPLLGKFRYVEEEDVKVNDLRSRIKKFGMDFIEASDQKRFGEFYDFDTLPKRVDDCGDGYISAIFKLKQEDGNYRWKEISILMIPGTRGKEFLLCIKNTAGHVLDYDSIHGAGSRDLYASMWHNLVDYVSIKFFWKDKDRKFIGASKSFMDYFGFIGEEELLGKDDEDLGWNLDSKSFREDELRVLTKGERIFNVPGQCLVNGIVHNIIVNKIPIYIDGRIVGLMGYFIDIEKEIAQ